MVDRDVLEAQKELTAHAFGQAQAYTNVILVVGYAGFFAIWSFVKADMTRAQVFWSGLLIALSLTAFILWEIYGAFYRSRSLLSLARAVNDPSNFEKLIAQHRSEERTRVIWLGRVWAITFGFTVITGFSAVGILLWVFVSALWELYSA